MDVVDIGAGHRQADARAGRLRGERHRGRAAAPAARAHPRRHRAGRRRRGLPLADASVDVATVGEAWHWFDHAAAADELARVVRPGGGVALIWQQSDPQSRPAWMQRTWEIVRAHRGDHPAFGDDEAGRPVARRAIRPSTACATAELSHLHHTDHDGVVAEAASISYIAAMDAHDRATLLGQLAAVVPRGALSRALPDRRLPHPPARLSARGEVGGQRRA